MSSCLHRAIQILTNTFTMVTRVLFFLSTLPMVIFSAKEGYSKLSSALTASSYDQYTFEYRWERESLHPMAISALNKEHIISSRALMMSSYGHIVFENRLGEKSLQYSAYCDGAGLIWESPGNCNASVKYCQRCVDDTGTVTSDVVYCNDTSGQLACKPKSSYNSLYFRITSDGFTNCVDDQNGLLPLRMAPCGNASAKNQYFSFAQLTGQISGYHFNLSLPRQCIDVGNLTTGILYKPCEKVSSSAIGNQIFVQEDNGLFQAVAMQHCLKRSSADSLLSLAPCNASDPLQQFDTYVGVDIPHFSPHCYPGTYGIQWESPGNCHADTTTCQTCSEEGAIAYCDDTSGIIVCEKLTSLTDYYFTMTSDDAMNCVDDSNGTQPLRMAPCGGVNKTNQLFSFAQLTGQISGYHYDLSRPRLCLDFSDLTAGILYKPCEDISSTAISNQIFVEENRLFQAVVEQQCLKRSLVDSSLTLAPCNASDPLEQFHTYAYCRPGEYSPGENQCTLCPAGTYSNSSGATTCEFCQPGTYSQRNSTSCTPCHLNNANGCLPYIVKAIYGEKEIGNGYSVVCNSGTYAAVVSVYLNEANFVDNFVLGCSDGNLPYLDSPNQFSNNYFDAFNSDLSGIFAVGGYWLDSMFFYIDGSWQNYGGDSGKDLYVRICGGNDVIAGFTNVYYNSSNSYIASFDIICSTPCPAGRYGASSCDLCPAGSYSYYGSYECTLCPAGTYSSATGADSIDACVPCPSGTFSSAVGATSISSCTDCPTGSYPTTNATTCISCDKNKAGGCLPYTISGVHGQEASVSSYATCNNGTYAEAIVIFTDADITFVAGLGVFCSDGFYNDITFSSSSRYQLAYNADSSGFTNVSGKAGLYVDAMVLEVDGQLIPFGGIGGASPYFTSCSGGDVIVGFTNVHEDSDQFQYLAGFDIVCGTPCPAGRYGASACDLCPAGTYSGNGSYSCTPCPAGNYSSAAGQSSCLACPSGTYSVTTGANSLGACLACPSGPSSLCILSSTVSSTLIPTALPMAAAPSSEYLVRYLVNHTFTGNTLPSYDAFASALTAPMDVTTGQIGILSIAFSPYGQLNTMRFGQTIIIIWELTYLNGAIPSLGIVTQRVNNLDLTSLSLKFPIANVILDEGPSVSIFRNSNFIRVNFDQYRSLQSSIIANYSFNAFWSVRSTTTGDVPLAGVRLTQSSSMVFNASAAAQGVAFPLVVNFSSAVFGHNETYIIRLETSSSLYASTIIYDEVKALLYVPPSGGWLLVHPNQVPTAVPLSSITPSKTILFDLSAPNWIDSLHKGPLLYQFFFSVGSSSPLLALADRSFSSTMTTELPRGQNLTIVVVVQTLSGATSTATNYTNPVALQNLTLESFSASMLRTTSSIGPLNNFLTALNNVNSTLLLPEGFACNHSTDCLTGLCQDRSCIATSSQKLCPSNSTTSSCSGHGNCVFLDSVGNTVSSCASNATNCMAFCRCDVDYGGQGCERHVNVSMLEDEIRGSACATLGNLLQNSAASSYDAVSTLKVLYQPGRISSQSSISSCMEAFQTLLKNLTLGRGVNDTLIALEAMSIISSIGESHFYAGIQGNGTNASITQISTNALLDAFASNLLINTVVGQSHNLNAGYLQLSIKTDYLTSIAGSAVSPSNVSLSRITFDGNGLNDCYAQGGHAKLVLSEWTLNPYPNSESLRTNLLGMSAPDPSLPPSLSSGHSSVYYMTLAFTSQQNLSLALPAEGASNQTVPECTTRVNGIYQPCNCNLSSYTNFSAVFVCGVRENLCPSISSSATNAPRHQALNPSPSSDSNALNIREYSALLGSASAEISSTLLFRGSLDTNVLAVVLFLLLSLIAGLIFFSRWDAMDRRVLLYVPKVQRKSMSMLDFKEIETFRKGLDAAFLAGALPPSVFMDERDIEFDRRSRWIRSLQGVFKYFTPHSERLSVLVGGSLLPRMLDSLRRFHPWLWFFSDASLVNTRVVRFVTSFHFILTSVFVSTVLYGVYYPVTNSCASFNGRGVECLQVPSTILSGESQCNYDISNGVCSLRPPPQDAAFLVIVAFATVVIMIPFNLVFFLTLKMVCSKRPRLEAFGINTFELLGSEDPEAKKQARDAADDIQRVDVISKSIYGSLYHYGERLRMGTCYQDEINEMDFILQKLGLKISDTGRLRLSWLSRRRFTDVHACIRYHVKSSVASCRSILLNMQRYEGVPEKQAYLIQRFLIERFSFFYRVSLYRNFNHSAYEFPRTIHPIAWIVGWLIVIGSVLFFVIWVLLWGSANAHGAVVRNWAINFSLANLQEVFIFSVARIFFLNIFAIDTIRPRLERLRALLVSKTAADEELLAEGISVEGQSYLLQYLEPSLLAAKLADARQLETISDAELWKLSKGPPATVEDRLTADEDYVMDATFISKGISYSVSQRDSFNL